jgi:hypothetical protein
MAIKTGGQAIDYGPYYGSSAGESFGRYLPQRAAMGYEEFSPDQLAAQKRGELEAREKGLVEQQGIQQEKLMRQQQIAMQQRQLDIQEEQSGKGGK